ncbi:hypothetical protein B0A55_09827 [Friedmanniomyces simplex]|uniref:Malate dehydrogenase n=1 Tax=Friedmanniomyces simplex TaxID=329884 RepID=A0A4U0X5X7_9PEZI|nr:hypothetical protein B0A55_09827 [Friedmanniomyces simplex]
MSPPAIPLDEVATTASSALPAPTGSLKFIALQLGTQNYTCNSTSGKYTATGALAQIFDATAYLTKNPAMVDSLSLAYLDLYTSLPCSKWPSDSITTDDQCEDKANSNFARPLPRLGEHYFTSTAAPTFDLYAAPGHPYMYAAKKADVPAPDSGDVDWLYLASNGSTSNHGISSVYRIETAGGVQPSSCSGAGSIYVPYAGQYWYYG